MKGLYIYYKGAQTNICIRVSFKYRVHSKLHEYAPHCIRYKFCISRAYVDLQMYSQECIKNSETWGFYTAFWRTQFVVRGDYL